MSQAKIDPHAYVPAMCSIRKRGAVSCFCTKPPDLTKGAPCRIGEHGLCHGNKDITAGGYVALRLRCSCACHRTAL